MGCVIVPLLYSYFLSASMHDLMASYMHIFIDSYALFEGKTITSGGKKLIAEVLRANVAHLNVQIKGCRLFATLAAAGLPTLY